MENHIDQERYMMCPYNSSHNIRAKKMAFHLTKCAKNYEGQHEIKSCDFNTNHRIPEPELQYHHTICEDRKKVEALMYEQHEDKYPVYQPHDDDQLEDNWDDLDAPSYDPTKYTENTDVLRKLDVQPQAERKNFRIEERRRHHDVGNEPTKVKNQPTATTSRVLNLPPHQSNASSVKVNPNDLVEKIKEGATKMYLQYP